MDINTPADFAMWFYGAFMAPLISILKDTTVLGFSLFSWILSMSLIALGVRFVRVLFSSGDNRG